MKIIFTALICLFTLVGFTSRSSAQAIPDTARLAFGVEGGDPAGSISGRYTFMIGASLRYDYPITKHSYITASVGYQDFSVGNGSLTTQQAILNKPIPTLQTMPLKIGYKLFLVKRLYVQVESGTTKLLNKKAEFAYFDYAFTYAPGFGFLFNTKGKGYYDVGVRYEGVSSFYNDNDKYNFWALHFAYAFKL